MTNGDVIKKFFNVTDVKFYSNLSGWKSVEVKFEDDNFLGGIYATHTFAREWWDAENLQIAEYRLKMMHK